MTPASKREIGKYAPLLLVVGATFLLYYGKGLLVPLAFAFTLCFLLLPAVRWLEGKRLPRAAAVAIVSTLACTVLVLGTYLVTRQILQVAATLPEYRGNMQKRLAVFHYPVAGVIGQALAGLGSLRESISPTHAAAPAEPTQVELVGTWGQFETARQVISLGLGSIAEVGIVFVFALYMLMRREDLRHRLLMLAGTRQLGRLTRALDDAGERISKYLVLMVEVNACYGILFAAGLYLMGVPNAILWGFIAGLLRVVPYVGTAAGMALPLTVSIAISTSWWPSGLVIAWFVILEAVAGNLVEPWLFSSRVGVSSLALLASAIFWTVLWGLPGLVLSTPLTVCVMVIGRYVPQFSFMHSLLGTDAQLSPAAHFYERLLATDHAEAYAIATRFQKGKPLIDLYDTVLIPALGLAEEDRHQGALDQAQADFILLNIRDLVARLADPDLHSIQAVHTTSREMRIEALRPSLIKELAVVCISAGDPADNLTTLMLTQLLEGAKYQAIMLAPEALSDEILAGLAEEKDTVLVVSALPPFAFAQVRAICFRVRRYLPQNRIMIGLWNAPEDRDEMIERLSSFPSEAVVSTLAQAMRQISEWQEATRRV